MANQITPNPSVPTQIVADGLKFPKFVNNLGIIPTSYKDSMSYYETLAWFCKYLEDTVIPTVNQNGEAVEELQNLYIELNSYVDHYFDTLDVQEEINNKLDTLVEDGTLEELIGIYIDSEITPQIQDINNNISVLSNRIDSFTHLEEGSTTGDAELIDGRIGFTGSIYSNIGDNIRTNDEDSNKRIDKLNDWINYKIWRPGFVNKFVALGSGLVNLSDSPSNCFSGYFYCEDYSTVTVTVDEDYSTRFYFIDKNDGTYTNRNNSDAQSTGNKTFTIQPGYNYMLFNMKKDEGGSVTPTECINNIKIEVEIPTNIYQDLKCDFVKIGGASKYITNLKIYSDEYENFMISNIKNNYEDATSFSLYSCNSDATVFESIKAFDLNSTSGHMLESFGHGSYIECDYDLTDLESGTRYTTSGYQSKVKKERIEVPLSKSLLLMSNTAPQKIITLIDDDTNSNQAIAKVKTLCDNLGVKCTFGCVTDRLGTNQSADVSVLQNYQKAGFHITTHSGNHTRWYQADADENPKFNAQEIETDLIESIETLKGYGFLDCDMLVYPGNSDSRVDVDVPAIAKKWCRCGVRASGGCVEDYGQGKYKITRTFITNDHNTEYYTNLLNQYTADDMPWYVFGTHSAQDTFDETLVSGILEYAINNGWKVMTLNEALKYREKFYTIKELFGL